MLAETQMERLWEWTSSPYFRDRIKAILKELEEIKEETETATTILVGNGHIMAEGLEDEDVASAMHYLRRIVE